MTRFRVTFTSITYTIKWCHTLPVFSSNAITSLETHQCVTLGVSLNKGQRQHTHAHSVVSVSSSWMRQNSEAGGFPSHSSRTEVPFLYEKESDTSMQVLVLMEGQHSRGKRGNSFTLFFVFHDFIRKVKNLWLTLRRVRAFRFEYQTFQNLLLSRDS